MMKLMNILCATDDNYVPHCGIMLTSLIENNRDTELHIYIFTGGLLECNKSKLKLISQDDFVKINIIEIDSQQLDISILANTIKEGDHVTISAYYRLLASLLLPRTLERVLYLDVDMIINTSLIELYNWDIENYALGVVVDENYHAKDIYERLNINKSNKYFNSGMLLINLDYWRKHNVVERCFQCIEEYGKRLLYHDQDTLNIVLQDEKTLLPLTWNFQTGFIWKAMQFTPEEMDEILTTSLFPAILHYSGPAKPWTELSPHPYQEYYLHYKKGSLWRKAPLNKKSLKSKIVYFLWNIGLKKKPESIYIIKRQHCPKK